jgi:hypothetical protein
MIRSFFLLFFTACLSTFSSDIRLAEHWNEVDIYPPCSLYGDTYGKWLRTSAINSTEMRKEVLRHFFLSPPPEIIFEWSEIWLPYNCSYHRFTNSSFFHVLHEMFHNPSLPSAFLASVHPNGTHLDEPTHGFSHHIIDSDSSDPPSSSSTAEKKKKKEISIGMFGDSATRGVVCGITRILSGSELYGPCDNVVCGGSSGLPVTFKAANQFFDLFFSPDSSFSSSFSSAAAATSLSVSFKLTFSYIYAIDKHSGDSTIERFLQSSANEADGNHPFAMILNTGAWDFDELARANQHNFSFYTCDTPEANKISLSRSSVENINKMKYFAFLAKKAHFQRLLYRNNHYNIRFGALCADERLENALTEFNQQYNVKTHLPWEIWDNRRISETVWREQCWDGFHFDRHKVNSYEHNVGHMAYFKSHNWDSPGELEIQLAQSLLNALFYDYLMWEYEKRKIKKTKSKKEKGESLNAIETDNVMDAKEQNKNTPETELHT